MQLKKLSSLALLPALAGCATVGMMKELPSDAGGLASYAATPDTLVAVAEAAIRQQHMRIADTSQPEVGVRVVIASRPPGLFSNGEFVRVRIAPDSGGLMAVRIVTQSGYLLDLGHRNGAPQVFGRMATQPGVSPLGPWPGVGGRATPHGAGPITGPGGPGTVDTLALP